MLELPQRRQHPTRDEFAAAVISSFQDLWQQYLAEPVGHANPDWAQGADCYNIALPIDVARDGGDAHGISNIVKHAIEMNKKSIGRIARVERADLWIVFFEAK